MRRKPFILRHFAPFCLILPLIFLCACAENSQIPAQTKEISAPFSQNLPDIPQNPAGKAEKTFENPAGKFENRPENGSERSVLVLMYHHLDPHPASWGDYVISPDLLEADLRLLKEKGYQTVPLSALVSFSEGVGELPEKPLIITFDDGQESVYAYALPLLAKVGFTGAAAVVGSLADAYTAAPDHNLRYSYMDWEEIGRLDFGGILEPVCHSYDMHKLSPRRGCDRMPGESAAHYKAALNADFSAFRAAFEAHLGHGTDCLALPYGAYQSQTVTLARAAGFRVIFTCEEKQNTLCSGTGELPLLGRFNRPAGETSEEFFRRIGA